MVVVTLLVVVWICAGCSALSKGNIKEEDLIYRYKVAVNQEKENKAHEQTKVIKDKVLEIYKGKKGYQYNVELKGVQILDFIDVIFNKTLGVSYVVDQSIKSNSRSLDLNISQKISRTQLYRIAIKAIEKVGYWVEEDNGVLYIYGKEDKEARISRVVYHVTLSNVTTDDIIDTIKGHIGKSEDVSITGDSRRTIVISGEYYASKRLAEIAVILDQVQKRIRLDVEVYEMSLTGSMKIGFEGFLNKTIGDGTFNLKTPVLELPSVYSGLISISDQLKAMVSLMKKDDILKTVAKPFLYCTEAKECKFSVGSKVPVLQSSKVSNEGTSTVNSVQYQDTGISIIITPVAISGLDLMLSIDFTSSKSSPNTVSNLDSPIIINRKLISEVRIKSGNPLLIAGIIYNQKESIYSGLPFDNKWLERIKNRSMDELKTEMIIVVTPYVVEDKEIDEINKKLSESMASIK